MINDKTIPGPAYCAAACPVRTNIPAPIMAPIPRVVRLRAVSDLFSPPDSLDSFSNCASGFVRNSLLFDIWLVL